MAKDNNAIQQFNDLLLHKLSLQERHRFKTDSFESEEINHLYRSVQNYQKDDTTENLSILTSALKQCESFKKDLPYKELHALLEKMESNNQGNNPPRRLSK